MDLLAIMYFLWTKSNSVFLPETQQWINSPCRVFSSIFTSLRRKKINLALKTKSFNIIIANGRVLLWKAKILNMICHADRAPGHQGSLVSNELLRQKENCSRPKLKDKLRPDEKNFEEGGGGCPVSKMMMMLPDL